jgi:hypothetical protein
MSHANNTVIDHAANGRLGAGAKTPEGLAASARNSIKHGLSARTFCLMHNEDAAIFAQHSNSLMATLAPRNPLELLQVQRIIECSWLIQRANQLETLAWQRELECQRLERRDQFENIKSVAFREGQLTYFAFESLESTDKNFQSLSRYRTTHERSLQRALNTLAKMRGGATNLSTNIWPDSMLPTPPIPDSNFCEPRQDQDLQQPQPETQILQNEAQALSEPQPQESVVSAISQNEATLSNTATASLRNEATASHPQPDATTTISPSEATASHSQTQMSTPTAISHNEAAVAEPRPQGSATTPQVPIDFTPKD